MFLIAFMELLLLDKSPAETYTPHDLGAVDSIQLPGFPGERITLGSRSPFIDDSLRPRALFLKLGCSLTPSASPMRVRYSEMPFLTTCFEHTLNEGLANHSYRQMPSVGNRAVSGRLDAQVVCRVRQLL
jgi:hypothetical protein